MLAEVSNGPGESPESKSTYRSSTKSKFDVVSILDAFDHILDDIVAERNGKGLRRQTRVLATRTL